MSDDIAACIRAAADAMPDDLAGSASADFLGHLADDWPKIVAVIDAAEAWERDELNATNTDVLFNAIRAYRSGPRRAQ